MGGRQNEVSGAPTPGSLTATDFFTAWITCRNGFFIFSPLERRYSNYDIEIASIDVKKFPAVALYLNVRDRGGKPLYGLTRDNFSVTEDGARPSGIYVDYLKYRSPSPQWCCALTAPAE